ncbi:MAG: cytochrome c [Candidatus Coatesbacteria bacterium]
MNMMGTEGLGIRRVMRCSVAVLLAGWAACAMASDQGAGDKPAKAAGKAPAAAVAGPGKKVYDAKCASCHRKDGKGNPAMAKMLKKKLEDLDLTDKDTQGRSDADLLAAITDGKPAGDPKASMKGWKGKVTEQEIKDLLAYIRSLAAATGKP